MNSSQNSERPVINLATNKNVSSFPVNVSLITAITSLNQCESKSNCNTTDSRSTKQSSKTTSANKTFLNKAEDFFDDRLQKNQTEFDKVFRIGPDSYLNTQVSNEINVIDYFNNEKNVTFDNINQSLTHNLELTTVINQKSKLVSHKSVNNSYNNNISNAESERIAITNSHPRTHCINQDDKLIYDQNNINKETNVTNTAILPVNSNNECSNVNTNLFKSIHILNIESSDQEVPSNLSSDELSEKHFQCNFCNKKFNNKQNCDRHYRTHTNDKPYECNVCGRRFPFQRSRDRHYRIHTNVKAYECNICKKRFSRNQGLKSHILTHTKEKPHQCEICSKRFPRIGSLRQHYRLHTKERPYDCEACGNSFSLKRNRDKHFRVVHLNEKPFQCKECSKKFSSLKTMQCHFSTHTNEKPYLCDVCNKRYSHKASLTLHCKQHLSSKDINIPDINDDINTL